MKLNKRGLLVEGIMLWLIITGLFGIHFKLDNTKIGSFIGGNLFYSAMIIIAILIIYLLIKLFKWINEDTGE